MRRSQTRHAARCPSRHRSRLVPVPVDRRVAPPAPSSLLCRLARSKMQARRCNRAVRGWHLESHQIAPRRCPSVPATITVPLSSHATVERSADHSPRTQSDVPRRRVTAPAESKSSTWPGVHLSAGVTTARYAGRESKLRAVAPNATTPTDAVTRNRPSLPRIIRHIYAHVAQTQEWLVGRPR